MVIGGIFAVAAVILSALLIVVRRASLRFDEWLLGKIPLRLAGIQFYGWYALAACIGLLILVILYEIRLVGPALLISAGGVLVLVVGTVLAWHRKILRDQGVVLFKKTT